MCFCWILPWQTAQSQYTEWYLHLDTLEDSRTEKWTRHATLYRSPNLVGQALKLVKNVLSNKIFVTLCQIIAVYVNIQVIKNINTFKDFKWTVNTLYNRFKDCLKYFTKFISSTVCLNFRLDPHSVHVTIHYIIEVNMMCVGNILVKCLPCLTIQYLYIIARYLTAGWSIPF